MVAFANADLYLSTDNPIVPVTPSTTYTGSGVGSRITQQFYVHCDCDGNITDSGLKALPQLRVMPCTGIVVERNPNLNIRQQAADCCLADVVWDIPEGRQGGNDEPEKLPGQLLTVNFGSSSRQGTRATAFQSVCLSSEYDGSEILENQPVFDEECRVIGCPVTVSTTQYCESFCVSRNIVDKNYCRGISMSIGTLNSQPFRDCDPCEMKLISVQANRNSIESDWTFDFCFEKGIIQMVDFEVLDFIPAGTGGGSAGDATFITRSFMVGPFDHVRPITHTYTQNGQKLIVQEKVWIHQPNIKTDFAGNLGL